MQFDEQIRRLCDACRDLGICPDAGGDLEYLMRKIRDGISCVLYSPSPLSFKTHQRVATRLSGFSWNVTDDVLEFVIYFLGTDVYAASTKVPFDETRPTWQFVNRQGFPFAHGAIDFHRS